MDIINGIFSNADILKITRPNFFGQRALESQMNTEYPRRAMNNRELLLIFAEFLCWHPLKEDWYYDQKLLFVFVDHKILSASTARPESLLQSIGEKNCWWIVPSDWLDWGLGQLQASIFSAPLIGSISNTFVKKRRTLADHRPDVEFIVQLLVHARLRAVCILPPWRFCVSS